MKNLRKLFAMLLALGLILALCVPAFAGETAKTGSVTVNNGENGNTYELYQILIPKGEGYKVTSDWESKVKVENGVTSVNFGGEGSEWTILSEPVSSDTVTAFLNHAKPLSPTGIAEVTEGKAVFSKMPYGYYLIDYADGTGGLFELKDSVYSIEKKGSGGPGIVKKIKLENGELVDWTTVNDGDVVSFEVEVTLPSEEDWKDDQWSYGCFIEDDVSDGLRQNEDVEVSLNGKKVIGKGETECKLSDESGDMIRIEYDTGKNEDEKKHFAIRFGELGGDGGNQDGAENGTLAFLKLHPGAKLTLSYSATVINKAIQTPEEYNKVTYYFGGESLTDKVYVYDFTIIIDKRDSGDNNIGLDGAEFVLQNAEEKFYWSDQKSDETHHAGDKVQWLEAELDKDTGEFTLPQGITERLSMVRVTNEWNLNGVTHFEGIPTGTYYLYEIKAPEGYARRREPIEIKIFHTETGTDGKEKFQYTIDGGAPSDIISKDVPWGGGWNQLQLTTQVGNTKEGALLPTTGGIGTTLFYMGGGVLVVGAACFILFKNRKGA
ncbi:SpaA isopeptide-forming pilin-related protein [Acutalibacter muris]|uniref:SpaA isopeptide-forming pilin-related protein n=1 Tax=Acutalibacter muris TaxID=1796620 RepID=UPI001C3EB538|nr:SpaA isopeptide-forming pilin-related protein [Acutalibacter muris]